MARQKRKATHLNRGGRIARPRTTAGDALITEGRPVVTGDLNHSPPASERTEEISRAGFETEGEASVHGDSRVSSVLSLEEEERLAEAEMRRLEEQHQVQMALMIQKKEQVEKRKAEELARLKAEEEERIRKEEEIKAEEERKRIEEERVLKEKEEERLRMETEAMRLRKEASEKEVTDRRMTRSGAAPSSRAKQYRKSIKGKSPLLSSGSSSETADGSDSDNQLTNPRDTTLATTNEPHGTPMQFTNVAARLQFEILAGQKLNMERGFEVDFMKANAFVGERVAVQGWETLVEPNKKANSSCVKEFYAEAAQKSNSKVKVRGVWVQYNAANINRVLGIKTPKSCAFSSLMQELTEGDEAEILAALVTEGKTWEYDGARKILPANYLTTEAAVWFSFLRHSLMPTTHDTDLSKDRCCLLFCILKGMTINLGSLMHTAIFQARTRKKVSLPLPCLITALLIDAGVPAVESDVWITSATTISGITIQRMGRPPLASGSEAFAAGLGTSTKFDPRAGSSATRGGGMGAILAELKDIKEQLQDAASHRTVMDRMYEEVWNYVKERDEVIREFFDKKDPEVAHKFPIFPPGLCPESGPEDDEFESPTH